MGKELLTLDNLKKWYVEERKTKLEISKLTGCCNNTITVYLTKFGIRSRSRVEVLDGDLTNNTFDKLFVVRRVENDKQGKSRYYCECSCGGNIVTNASSLTRKLTRSCGCLRKAGDYECITSTYFSHLKTSALKRNKEFNVTIQDIYNQYLKQDKKCPYTNIELNFTPRYGDKTTSNASVDRINNDKGYTVENIQIVHKIINYMKLCLSSEDFIKFCNLVAKNNSLEINQKVIEEINNITIHQLRTGNKSADNSSMLSSPTE